MYLNSHRTVTFRFNIITQKLNSTNHLRYMTLDKKQMSENYKKSIKVDVLILFVPFVFILFSVFILHNTCTSKYSDLTILKRGIKTGS